MGQPADKLCLSEIESPAASDQELIAEVLAGADERFEELFLRHRLRVARVASRFFNRPEQIEEVVQEAFAKAYFGLANYSADRGPSFAAWLSRVAINSCYDELRRAKRRPDTAGAYVSPEECAALIARVGDRIPNAESKTISRDLAHKLLSRLGSDDRLVLTLLDGEELPVPEIAAALGWGESKVKVRAHRARAALRKILKEFV